MDCIRPDIHAALDPVAAKLDGGWRPLSEHLAGHRYRALWMAGDTPGANPFRLLAASLADPAAEMGHHTLVLVGGTRNGQPGFVLLDGTSEPLSLVFGSGEELEDHACRIAARPG